MQVQVHTDNKIQGGESLAHWIQEEATARLGRFREYITRVEVFLSDVDAGKSGTNDKLADAFTGAVEKLARALDHDLGRVKDRNGRETIRTQEE